jgi:TetR/AcrR family transcriptional regulator
MPVQAPPLQSPRGGGKKPSSRQSADARRQQVLQAAVAEFAIYGLHGTSAEQIAKRVKISQPYIFRLFPSKKELFIAAVDQCFDRVEAAFRAAVDDPARLEHASVHRHLEKAPINARLHAMGHAYAGLLGERELLLFQMQAYAACSDEDVRRRVRHRWEQLVNLVGELSGASRGDITVYFARGMLMNVVASMGMIPHRVGKEWAHEALGYA